jgi:nanoRNase/pAp phosphatase (c-di-AMP/oligoRNAs hydrolase)
MTAIYEDPRFNGDFAVGLYMSTKSLSFRASPNSSINLGLIAKAMGGGGHPSAAGVKLSSEEFLEVLRRYYDSTEYLIPRK